MSRSSKEYSKKYMRGYMREYWKNNPEKYKTHKEKMKLNMRKKYKAGCNRHYKQKIRLQVLTHYGGNPPKCACCGETIVIFLVIDHINNDGAKQRKSVASGSQMYYWLRKNNFPEGYQVLCRNCNWAKSQGGCPHK